MRVSVAATLVFLWSAAFLEAVEQEREIPFRMEDGFVWLEVRTPKAERPLAFILDSGASVSVLNLKTSQELGLRRGLKVEVCGVGSDTTGYWPQRLSATTAGVALPRQYLAMDLGRLSSSCRQSLDGLLGMDFFHDKVVQVDYAKQVLRIADKELPATGGVRLPLTVRRCGMLTPVSVGGGKDVLVRIDTGCASWLHWVTSDVDTSGCSRRSAIGLTEMALPVVKTSVALGGRSFQEVPADMHVRPIFPGESGLLGNHFLAQFPMVTFDVPRKQLILHGQPQVNIPR